MEIDWQLNFKKVINRNQYLLQSKKMSDCRFLVGTSSNQSVIVGHRLILAAASPAFECMLYGSLQEKDDPIVIPDVQPDAFAAMLEYIYTDEISISFFDIAYDLYYAAKKYILPHVVEHCTNVLMSDLSPKNACRAYELGKLYEEPRLMESSMEHIAMNAWQVITDPSFIDIEVSTLMAILDLNRLNIDSELDLFNCLLKYANERGILNTPSVRDEVVEVDSDASDSGNSSVFATNIQIDEQSTRMDKAMLRQAVQKIHFLTMTPEQFAEGPARSKLLKQNEIVALFIKLVSPIDFPMPEGLSQLSKRDRVDNEHKELYCICRSLMLLNGGTYYHSCERNFCLPFKVDTNIYLLGVQIRSEVFRRDIIEGCYASIENMQGSEIACTSSKNKKIDSMYKLIFNNPVFIYRNQTYNIKIVNLRGYSYLMYSWGREKDCNDVKFNIPLNPPDKNIANPICGIVYSI